MGDKSYSWCDPKKSGFAVKYAGDHSNCFPRYIDPEPSGERRNYRFIARGQGAPLLVDEERLHALVHENIYTNHKLFSDDYSILTGKYKKIRDELKRGNPARVVVADKIKIRAQIPPDFKPEHIAIMNCFGHIITKNPVDDSHTDRQFSDIVEVLEDGYYKGEFEFAGCDGAAAMQYISNPEDMQHRLALEHLYAESREGNGRIKFNLHSHALKDAPDKKTKEFVCNDHISGDQLPGVCFLMSHYGRIKIAEAFEKLTMPEFEVKGGHISDVGDESLHDKETKSINGFDYLHKITKDVVCAPTNIVGDVFIRFYGTIKHEDDFEFYGCLQVPYMSVDLIGLHTLSADEVSNKRLHHGSSVGFKAIEPLKPIEPAGDEDTAVDSDEETELESVTTAPAQQHESSSEDDSDETELESVTTAPTQQHESSSEAKDNKSVTTASSHESVATASVHEDDDYDSEASAWSA